MSLWRKEAFERFPEFRTQLQKSKSAMAFWIELQFAFDEAYRKGDLDQFQRILDYADWCFHAPRGKEAESDLPSCILVTLFEHMPPISHDEPVDHHAMGLSLLNWDGPTSTHPHVRVLLQNLIDQQPGKKKRQHPKANSA
jgi:hypothetical protein